MKQKPNDDEQLKLTNYEEQQVPKLVSSATAGNGTPFYDGADFEDVPLEAVRKSKRPFIVHVQGDSMEPTLTDGDKLIVDTAVEPVHNDICAISLNDSIYIKRICYRGFSVFLKSDNSAYDEIKIRSTDNFLIFGKVISFIREL